MTSRSSYKVGRIRIDNEAAILAAAEHEFATHGFKGASMARIAEGAGVARTNVHYYFKNKTDLYMQALTNILESWKAVFPDISADDDPAHVLEQYIRAKMRYSRTHPVASRLFAMEIIRGAPMLREYLAGDHRKWLSGKARVIRGWIRDGKMDPVEPLHLIFMIWGTTQHYADFAAQMESVRNKDKLVERDFEAAADDIVRVVLKGCGLQSTGREKSH